MTLYCKAVQKLASDTQTACRPQRGSTRLCANKLLLTAAASTAALLLQSAEDASAAEHAWQPCVAGGPCVSTNSFMQPAQYLPPWLYQPDTQETALKSLLRELSARSAEVVEVDAAAGYVSARIPLSGSQDFDTLQFLLKPDGVVLFKSQSAANRPYPPFCFIPGCISGPANRQRLESLRDDLGWTVLEPDEEKQWVQILLH